MANIKLKNILGGMNFSFCNLGEIQQNLPLQKMVEDFEKNIITGSMIIKW